MKNDWVGSSESSEFALSASVNYPYSSALNVVNIIDNLRYIRYISNLVKHNQYTGCNRRNGPDFGRVFLRSNYTDITQNTYIQSSMVTEILAREV